MTIQIKFPAVYRSVRADLRTSYLRILISKWWIYQLGQLFHWDVVNPEQVAFLLSKVRLYKTKTEPEIRVKIIMKLFRVISKVVLSFTIHSMRLTIYVYLRSKPTPSLIFAYANIIYRAVIK